MPQTDPEALLADLLSDERVRAMRGFIQHGRVTTWEHCRSVARLSWRIDRRLRLGSDPETLLRGAMLHDFYLYDWHHEDGGAHRLHGFTHAETARRNAERILGESPRVQEVIRSHMWPLNITRVPRSREAWIVCLADKCVALRETLFRR